MPIDVRQRFLSDAVDLKLHVQRECDAVLDTFLGLESPVLDGAIEKELERGNETDVLEHRRTQVFAYAPDLGRDGFDLTSELTVVGDELVTRDHQISKIRESLIVEIACDPPSFALGLVCKIETRRRELAISLFDTPMFDDRPDQADE